LIGNDRLKGAASSAAAAASPMVDIGARNLRSAASGLQRTASPPTAPEMDHEASTRVGETLRDASNAASDAMSGAAEKIKDRFEEGVAYAQENFGKLGLGNESLAKAQSSLADMLERQPLVLGAIGLAIGATVAGAFRTSDLENEWIGDLSDDVKADLNTRAGQRRPSYFLNSRLIKAADKFEDKTTAINKLWQTDDSHQNDSGHRDPKHKRFRPGLCPSQRGPEFAGREPKFTAIAG
jgi:hypothetical protein